MLERMRGGPKGLSIRGKYVFRLNASDRCLRVETVVLEVLELGSLQMCEVGVDKWLGFIRR